MIAAIAPDERAPLVALNLVDLADEDLVIAAQKRLVQRAGKSDHHAGHQRNTVPTRRPFDAGEAIFFVAVGKARGQMLLVIAQYVDRKRLFRRKLAQEARAAVNADQNQRRIQRNGGERADRHPIRRMVGQAARDNGNARGKQAAGGTKFRRAH